MFDEMAVRQINLDFRTDRWEECRRNHREMGFAEHDVARFPACHDPQAGSLGCARSHVRALCDFFTLDRARYAMIIEDDFDFHVRKEEIAAKLLFIKDNKVAWDVLLLSGADVISYGSSVSFLQKVFEAQTTSGYIVRRAYVPTLMSCFMDAIKNLERFRSFKPAQVMKDRFSIDMAWKTLQRADNWHIFSPRLGLQRPSFSDVEGTVTDYRDRFLD